jgi:hypothetical protein
LHGNRPSPAATLNAPNRIPRIVQNIASTEIFMTEILFKPSDCHSLGRNGYIKTHGLIVQSAFGGQEIVIAPITSRKLEGRCHIAFPLHVVREVIDALTKIENLARFGCKSPVHQFLAEH